MNTSKEIVNDPNDDEVVCYRVVEYEEDESMAEDSKNWLETEGAFYPETEATVHTKMPSGAYYVQMNRNTGRTFLKEAILNSDEIIQLNNGLDKMVDEIVNFDSFRDIYKDNKIAFKRSYLLTGPPGTGKTSQVNLVIDKVLAKEKDFVVLILENESSFYNFKDIIKYFRNIEPDRMILVVIEDTEKLFRDQDTESMLINLIDGSAQVDNVIYILTTNNVELFPERMLRPSRIDEVVEILNPTEEDLKNYFIAKTKDEELTVKLTEASVKAKLSMANAKELFISVFIKNKTIEETILRLQDLKGFCHSKTINTESKNRNKNQKITRNI